MSPRDSYWFLAGALVSLATAFALRATFATPAATHPQPVDAVANTQFDSSAMRVAALIAQPDAVVDAAGTDAPSAPSAGSLDEVTGKLASRLAASGGTDDEWRLLAQSYDYMGRPKEAADARAHTANSSRSVRVSGTIELDAALARRTASGLTLFIYAKQPGKSGPPLAVMRVTADRWPVSFVLDDSNAMVPGQKLSNATTVLIEARVSRSGDALPRPGDLVGSAPGVDPRAGRAIKISIDREIG